MKKSLDVFVLPTAENPLVMLDIKNAMCAMCDGCKVTLELTHEAIRRIAPANEFILVCGDCQTKLRKAAHEQGSTIKDVGTEQKTFN